MPPSLLPLVLKIVLIVWLITLSHSILIMFCGKSIFKRANIGEKTAYIPIINLFSMLEVADVSSFLGILLFIPGLNMCVLAIMSYKLGVVFNTSFLFRIGLVLLPVIFYPILALSKKVYKLSDDDYFKGIENSINQKINLPESDVDNRPFVIDQIEEKKQEVDSIFKSNVEMMEKVAPYKAGKIDIFGMEKLEKAGSDNNNSIKSDKNKNNDDMEMIDL